MSQNILPDDATIPLAWDAKLILNFLHSPGFDDFDNWIDAELALLEARWTHASSPNALRGERITRRSTR